MSHNLSLIGLKFNRWTFLRPDGQMYAKPRAAWIAQCECGTTKQVAENNVKKGTSKSCGCLQKEQMRQKTIANAKRKIERTRWLNMIDRCVNPKNKSWNDYGGRGIKVCDQWMTFDNFYHDMGDAPQGMTIERKDINGNYEPTNCCWATKKEQAKNKQNSKLLTVGSVTKIQADWARDLGVRPALIGYRLKKGWTVEDACTKPPSPTNHKNRIKRLTAYLHKATEEQA